nr:MAG TPA: hypothetical protein [Caudoviricetes sp.]
MITSNKNKRLDCKRNIYKINACQDLKLVYNVKHGKTANA